MHPIYCKGSQNKDVASTEASMKELEKQQVLCTFNQIIKRLYMYLHCIITEDFSSNSLQVNKVILNPHSISVDADLNDGTKQVKYNQERMKTEGLRMLNFNSLQDGDAEFEQAL